MSTLTDVRNTLTSSTPLMAYVGVADLAVEKAREARVQTVQLAEGFTPAKMQQRVNAVQTEAVKTLGEVSTQVRELPGVVVARSLELAGKAQDGYADLATRGQGLVKRVFAQQSTKDMFAAADSTVASAKGTYTTAVHGAEDVQSSAKALFTTGRKEATKAAEAIADSVVAEAQVATDEVKRSVKATRTAAKRTSTTAKNAGTRTRTAAKRTSTTAKKTATSARKATTKAAEKVGH